MRDTMDRERPRMNLRRILSWMFSMILIAAAACCSVMLLWHEDLRPDKKILFGILIGALIVLFFKTLLTFMVTYRELRGNLLQPAGRKLCNVMEPIYSSIQSLFSADLDQRDHVPCETNGHVNETMHIQRPGDFLDDLSSQQTGGCQAVQDTDVRERNTPDESPTDSRKMQNGPTRDQGCYCCPARGTNNNNGPNMNTEQHSDRTQNADKTSPIENSTPRECVEEEDQQCGEEELGEAIDYKNYCFEDVEACHKDSEKGTSSIGGTGKRSSQGLNHFPVKAPSNDNNVSGRRDSCQKGDVICECVHGMDRIRSCCGNTKSEHDQLMFCVETLLSIVKPSQRPGGQKDENQARCKCTEDRTVNETETGTSAYEQLTNSESPKYSGLVPPNIQSQSSNEDEAASSDTGTDYVMGT